MLSYGLWSLPESMRFQSCGFLEPGQWLSRRIAQNAAHFSKSNGDECLKHFDCMVEEEFVLMSFPVESQEMQHIIVKGRGCWFSWRCCEAQLRPSMNLSWLYIASVSNHRLSRCRWNPPGIKLIDEIPWRLSRRQKCSRNWSGSTCLADWKKLDQVKS